MALLYKTRFNVVFPVLRLLIVFLSAGLVFLLLYFAFRDGNGNYAAVIAMCLAIGYLAMVEAVYLIKYSKNYSFFTDRIEIYNCLNGRRKQWFFEDMKGWGKSHIAYRGFRQQVVIGYRKDGTKMLLLQSNYLDFASVENCLKSIDLPYLGEKTFSWTYLE